MCYSILQLYLCLMISGWLNKPYSGAFINTTEISNLLMRENLVMTSLYGRTSVLSFRVGPSRHESLPLQQRVLSPIVSKGFRLDMGRNGFNTFNKMAGLRLLCGGFQQDQSFFIIIILRWKVHPQKTIKGKRNFKRSLSFPFVDKRNLFLTKLFFEELNLVFCKVERLACFWNNRGTQAGLLPIFKCRG